MQSLAVWLTFLGSSMLHPRASNLGFERNTAAGAGVPAKLRFTAGKEELRLCATQ
jgi:hypothetical protein